MPADPNQTDRIVRHAAAKAGNFFIGMGRSKIPPITDAKGNPVFGGDYVFTPGKADWLREGHQGAVLSYGSILHHSLRAREELAGKHGLKLAVINFASIKPLDTEAILEAAKTGFLITAEDHHVDTGLGARVAVTLADAGAASRLVRLGVRHYGSSGKPGDLYREAGIDSSGIVRAVLEERANGWISG
jgi:transketolase